jgi:hypothetical protein
MKIVHAPDERRSAAAAGRSKTGLIDNREG